MNLHHCHYRLSILLLFLALGAFAFGPAVTAAFPEAELKRVVSITLTTELLEKMEKFVTSVKSDAGAKAELAAATKEDKDKGLRGEAWGKLITAKCPKTVAIFEAAGLAPEEFGKATDAIEAIMFAEGMAPPGDPDNLAKSDNKTAVANAAFYNANKARCEAVYATFAVLGLLE